MTKYKTPESLASDNVLLAANANGCRLYRNNSGVAYDEKSNRPIFFGLGNDGVKNDESIRTHDWIGWHQVTITPDMVGKKLAVFTAIDAKKLGFTRKTCYPIGTREYGQDKFARRVIAAGGIAGFATNAEDVTTLITEFYQRVKT